MSETSPARTPPRADAPHTFHLPSPIPTKRNRTYSQSQRAHAGPVHFGSVKSFCREKGHGFIQPATGGDPIFVHISDIETDCTLVEGDQVTYKMCPIPPKMEKFSAVHVRMLRPKEGVEHQKWDNSHTHPEAE